MPDASVNDDEESLSINDTATRRFLTRLALKTTARLYRAHGVCRRVSPNKIIKAGKNVDLTEAATMRFIAIKTSLPVPKVHCAFVSGGCTYIVMERLKGEMIAQALSKTDQTAQVELLKQLRTYIDEMRALPAPGDASVQSCVGGSLYDSRIVKPEPHFGPFKTIYDFHLWLRNGLLLSQLKENAHPPELWEMIRQQDGDWPPPVFTHGDLNPGNILVHNGRISGIIDWEFAGWYPSYWEYTSSWYGNMLRTAWRDLLDKFLTPHPEELKMEIVRQKWWGEY